MALQPQLAAANEFRQLKFRGALQLLLYRLARKATSLCPFEPARKERHATVSGQRTLRDICLTRIVGSVGRVQDYTPTFLPRQSSDEARWVRVRLATEHEGLPPIEVYQLGESYYVLDGHHRVSVLRRLGARSIEAYVTKVAPLSPQTSPHACAG